MEFEVWNEEILSPDGSEMAHWAAAWVVTQ